MSEAIAPMKPVPNSIRVRLMRADLTYRISRGEDIIAEGITMAEAARIADVFTDYNERFKDGLPEWKPIEIPGETK